MAEAFRMTTGRGDDNLLNGRGFRPNGWIAVATDASRGRCREPPGASSRGSFSCGRSRSGVRLRWAIREPRTVIEHAAAAVTQGHARSWGAVAVVCAAVVRGLRAGWLREPP